MARESAAVLRELFRPLLLYIPLAFWTIALFSLWWHQLPHRHDIVSAARGVKVCVLARS